MADSTPWQLVVALTLQRININAMYTSIFPFVTVQVQESAGISPEKAGTVVGAVEGIFMLAEVLAAWVASLLIRPRTAGGFGQDQVKLFWMLLAGQAVCAMGYAFFTQGIWSIIFWGILLGLMCGSALLGRIILSEAVRPDDVVQAFAIFGSAAPIGMSVGPWIGGALNRAAERYEFARDSDFFKSHPFGGGSLLFGCTQVLILIYTMVVIPRVSSDRPHGILRLLSSLNLAQNSKAEPSRRAAVTVIEDMSYVALLRSPTHRTLLFLVSYGSLIVFTFESTFSIIAAAPVPLGGYYLDSPTIGTTLGTSTCVGAVMATLALPPLTKRYGLQSVLSSCSWCAVIAMTLLWLLVPIRISEAGQSLERNHGVTLAFWGGLAMALVARQVSCLCLMLAEGAIPLAVTASQIEPMTSLTFVLGGFARGGGAIMYGWLFSFSGHGSPSSWQRSTIWLVLIFGAVIFACIAQQHLDLPKESKAESDSSGDIEEGMELLCTDEDVIEERKMERTSA